jgi:hypothetical protein
LGPHNSLCALDSRCRSIGSHKRRPFEESALHTAFSLENHNCTAAALPDFRGRSSRSGNSDSCKSTSDSPSWSHLEALGSHSGSYAHRARACRPHRIAASRFGVVKRRVNLVNDFFNRPAGPVLRRENPDAHGYRNWPHLGFNRRARNFSADLFGRCHRLGWIAVGQRIRQSTIA